MDLVSTVIAYISAASPLIAFIVGIIYFSTFSAYLKVLFIYICSACCLELTSFYLLYQGVENNLFLGPINTIIEFSAFFYMYCFVLEIKNRKWVYGVVLILFTLFAVIDAFYIEGWENLNALSRNTAGIILIVCSIVYFYKLMVRAKYADILALPAFWINASVITYFSGGFFLILFSNHLIENDRVGYLIFFIIHSVFNITFNLLIAVGFFKQRNVR